MDKKRKQKIEYFMGGKVVQFKTVNSAHFPDVSALCKNFGRERIYKEQ